MVGTFHIIVYCCAVLVKVTVWARQSPTKLCFLHPRLPFTLYRDLLVFPVLLVCQEAVVFLVLQVQVEALEQKALR